MIYNLSEYISANTSFVPVTNGIIDESEGIFLTLTSGTDESRGIKKDFLVQIMAAYPTSVEAFQNLSTIYDLLVNRFVITLPEVTVNSVTYDAVDIAQILPMQSPGYLGSNENGLHMWSVNMQITTGR